MKNIENQYISK